jgi:hypothetical protein
MRRSPSGEWGAACPTLTFAQGRDFETQFAAEAHLSLENCIASIVKLGEPAWPSQWGWQPGGQGSAPELGWRG